MGGNVEHLRMPAKLWSEDDECESPPHDEIHGRTLS